MVHWFLAFGVALAHADSSFLCHRVSAAREDAPVVSAEVFLAFEDLAGASREEILALAQSPRSHDLPEGLLESARDFMPGVNTSRYERDLTTVHHIVSKLKIEGRALGPDEVEMLTLHIARAAFTDAPHETIVREIPLPRHSEDERRRPYRARPADIEGVINGLSGAVANVRPSERRFEELTEKERTAIRAVLPALLESSLRGREYAHRYWIEYVLQKNIGLNEVDAKRFMAWVDAAVLEHLQKEYAGEEGLFRFAKEFTGDMPFNSWVLMRHYASYGDLKALGWKVYFFGATGESIKEVRRLIGEDLQKFVETYHSEEGKKKLVDDYFRGVDRATQIVFSVLEPSKHYLLRWFEKDRLRYRILGESGTVSETYRGKSGKAKLFREIALERLQASDPDFPSAAEFMTPRQLEELKAQIRKIDLSARHVVPEAYPAMNWTAVGWIKISLPPDEFVKRYSGIDGQIRFAREHNYGSVKRAVSAAKKYLPADKFAALGWKTSFEGIDSAEALPSTLFHPDGSPRAEYVGRNGLIRYTRKHKAGQENSARVGAAAHLTPEQFQLLRWSTPQGRERKTEGIEARVRDKDNGVKPFFKGPAGFARYAALFHNGSDKRAMACATRSFDPGLLRELGWELGERQEPMQVRKILFTESLATLVTEEGALDAHYQGAKGLTHYLREFPKATVQGAVEYARTVLSPREFEQLGWEKLEKEHLGASAP